jgi:hypothetical protein
MNRSIAEGVIQTIKAINDTPGAFALGGYSQGAAVMSLVYNEVPLRKSAAPPRRLPGGVTFGNPLRESQPTPGPGTPGRGSMGRRGIDVGRARPLSGQHAAAKTKASGGTSPTAETSSQPPATPRTACRWRSIRSGLFINKLRIADNPAAFRDIVQSLINALPERQGSTDHTEPRCWPSARRAMSDTPTSPPPSNPRTARAS